MFFLSLFWLLNCFGSLSWDIHLSSSIRGRPAALSSPVLRSLLLVEFTDGKSTRPAVSLGGGEGVERGFPSPTAAGNRANIRSGVLAIATPT